MSLLRSGMLLMPRVANLKIIPGVSAAFKKGGNMECPRCKGNMMEESFFDLRDDTGRFTFRGWRCLICGEVFDSVISANRKLHPSPLVGKKRKVVIGVN